MMRATGAMKETSQEMTIIKIRMIKKQKFNQMKSIKKQKNLIKKNNCINNNYN